MDYYSKYLKYKNKYLNLKNNTNQSAGVSNVPKNFVIITNSKGDYGVINYDNYDRYIERWYDLKKMGWIDENEPMSRPLGGTNDESNSRQNKTIAEPLDRTNDESNSRQNKPMTRPLGGTNDESNSRQNNAFSNLGRTNDESNSRQNNAFSNLGNSNNTTYKVGDEVIFTPTISSEENVYNAPRGNSNIINRLNRGTSYRARVIRAIPSSKHNNVLVTKEYYTLQLLDPPHGYIPEASVGSISRGGQNNSNNHGTEPPSADAVNNYSMF